MVGGTRKRACAVLAACLALEGCGTLIVITPDAPDQPDAGAGLDAAPTDRGAMDGAPEATDGASGDAPSDAGTKAPFSCDASLLCDDFEREDGLGPWGSELLVSEGSVRYVGAPSTVDVGTVLRASAPPGSRGWLLAEVDGLAGAVACDLDLRVTESVTSNTIALQLDLTADTTPASLARLAIQLDQQPGNRARLYAGESGTQADGGAFAAPLTALGDVQLGEWTHLRLELGTGADARFAVVRDGTSIIVAPSTALVTLARSTNLALVLGASTYDAPGVVGPWTIDYDHLVCRLAR